MEPGPKSTPRPRTGGTSVEVLFDSTVRRIGRRDARPNHCVEKMSRPAMPLRVRMWKLVSTRKS